MIEDLLGSYEAERGCRRATLLQYRYATLDFSRWMGRELTPADWTDQNLNAFLVDLVERTRPHTARQRRANLLVVWRFGYSAGLIPSAPRRIRPVRVPELIRHTWTAEDVGRVIRHAEGLSGRFRGSRIPHALFWPAWLRAGWDSGLRPVDLFALRAEDVAESFEVVQSKTLRRHAVRFRPETVAAVNQLAEYHGLPLVFPTALSRQHLSRSFRKLAKDAGLVGSPKILRQSSATEVERENPQMAWRFLGHTTPTTSVKHYLGRRAYPDLPLPPAPEAG